MTNILEFLTGCWLQRLAISAIIVYICYQMGHAADSYLPWAIIVLVYIMEYLAYTEGVYAGARGFDRLPDDVKRDARKLWSNDE